jgi:hypothetical protein
MKKQATSISPEAKTISDLFQSNILTDDDMKHLIGGDEDSGGTRTTPIDRPIYVYED